MSHANTLKEGLSVVVPGSIVEDDDAQSKPCFKVDILHKVLVLLIVTGAGWGLIGALVWLDLKPVYYSIATQIMLCLSGLSVGAVFGLLIAVLFDIVILGRLDS